MLILNDFLREVCEREELPRLKINSTGNFTTICGRTIPIYIGGVPKRLTKAQREILKKDATELLLLHRDDIVAWFKLTEEKKALSYPRNEEAITVGDKLVTFNYPMYYGSTIYVYVSKENEPKPKIISGSLSVDEDKKLVKVELPIDIIPAVPIIQKLVEKWAALVTSWKKKDDELSDKIDKLFQINKFC